MKYERHFLNNIEIGVLLRFEAVFPDEERLSFEQYLSGCGRETILKASAFLLNFKKGEQEFSNIREFISNFFQKKNHKFGNYVYSKIEDVENRIKKQIGITNVYSSLTLFEYYFSQPETLQIQTSAELEVSLFKAYLSINSDFIELQEKARTSTKSLSPEEKYPMMMFCMQYPISDKTHYDISQIWVTQLIKAIYLYEFLEKKEEAKFLLNALLKEFQCKTWQEFLKSLIPLTTPAIKSSKKSYTDIKVEPGEDYEKNCLFIDKLIVQKNDELDENDFLTIRAKPLYKVKEGIYRVIFDLFVVEKIFKGAYFLLRDINKALPKKERIKEIRSFYGYEFSEKELCYRVVKNIYPSQCIRFSGYELSQLKIDSAPDFYVRKGNNILLFESKDFLIRADKKMSFNYEVYYDEFSRVLDYEEISDNKIKPKAVVQLANSVRKLLKGDFAEADSDFNYRKVSIYPILLTHDHQYNAPGFNDLINRWFQDELLLLKEDGIFIHKVAPLSIVNIDTLIYNQVGLSKSVPLHKMLDLYHIQRTLPRKKAKSLEIYEKLFFSRLVPFSNFVEAYFRRHNLFELPPDLNTVASSLFESENAD
jgi:hypothetical protein